MFQYGTFFFSYQVQCAPSLGGSRCDEYVSSPTSASLTEEFHSRNGFFAGEQWPAWLGRNHSVGGDHAFGFKGHTEPVVLECSHSFCKVCLQQCWGEKSSRECPICRRKSNISDPPVSLSLKNIASYLKSYLTQETESEARCRLHGEKLLLYCEDDQEPLCLVCQTSKKHRNHRICPVEEAALDMKGELKTALNPIREKLERFTEVKQECEKTAEHIRNQAQHTERQVKAEFQELHQFLRDEEEARLAALREEEEQKSQMVMEKIEIITRHISTLSGKITAIEKAMCSEDISLLRTYTNIKERAQCTLQDPQLISGALIDVAKHLGNLKYRVWEKMLEMVQYTSVILDPNTAPAYLSLSDDLNSVRHTDTRQQLPDNPESSTQTVGLIHTLEQCLNSMQTVGLIHTLEQCLNRMQTVGLIHTLEQCLNRMQTVGLIHTLEQCLNSMQTMGLIHTLEQCLNSMQTVGLIHTLEQCLNSMQTVGLIHTLEQCLNSMQTVGLIHTLEQCLNSTQTVGLIHTLEQCLNSMQTMGLIHTPEQCLNRMQTMGLIHTLEQCLNRMQTVGLIHTLEQCLNRMQTVGLIHTLEQCLNRMQTVGLMHALEHCLNRMQTVGLIHTLEQCLNSTQTMGLIHTLEQCLNSFADLRKKAAAIFVRSRDCVMPRHCSAAGCKSRDTRETRKAGITFHRLPKRGKPRRTLWILNSRRTGPQGKGQWDPQSHFIYFCSKHFTPESFELSGVSGYRRLKEDALPTVFETLPRQRRGAGEKAQRGRSKQTPAKRQTRRQTRPLKQETEESEPGGHLDTGSEVAGKGAEKSEEAGWDEDDKKSAGGAETGAHTLPPAPSPPPPSSFSSSPGPPQIPPPSHPAFRGVPSTSPAPPPPSQMPPSSPPPSPSSPPANPPSPSRYMRRLPPPPGFYLPREHSYAQLCPQVWRRRYDRAIDSLEKSMRLLNAARRRENRLRQTLLQLRESHIKQNLRDGAAAAGAGAGGGREPRPGKGGPAGPRERGVRQGAEESEVERAEKDLTLIEDGLGETGEWDRRGPAGRARAGSEEEAGFCFYCGRGRGEGGGGGGGRGEGTRTRMESVPQPLPWLQQAALQLQALQPVQLLQQGPAPPQDALVAGPGGEAQGPEEQQRVFWLQEGAEGRLLLLPVTAGEGGGGAGEQGAFQSLMVSAVGFQKATADEGEAGRRGARTTGRSDGEGGARSSTRTAAGSADVRERLKEHLEGFQLQLSNEFIN
ncbi:hypothetical protein AAFF_G00169710 [Aldrovandia affinis]|uniref:Uncharacterized protein n=1 Tax=Aldrovandia affinis TaxID=143900 RepID=A0AAD7W6X9_9TELE|nr:hypothetical protein AAFF_G00169710 [Aldrovandia affinis]